MSSNPNKIISLQELINAQVDAYKLELIMNEAPWVEVTTRLGRKCYSIATIQGIIDQYRILVDQELDNLRDTIEIAAAAGAGAAGWTDKLVQTWSGRIQEEENKDFVTSVDNYADLNNIKSINGRSVNIKNSKIAGQIIRDDSINATKSGGIIIIDKAGNKYRRIIQAGHIKAEWYDIANDGSVNEIAKTSDFLSDLRAYKLKGILPAGIILVDPDLDISGVSISGATDGRYRAEYGTTIRSTDKTQGSLLKQKNNDLQTCFISNLRLENAFLGLDLDYSLLSVIKNLYVVSSKNGIGLGKTTTAAGPLFNKFSNVIANVENSPLQILGKTWNNANYFENLGLYGGEHSEINVAGGYGAIGNTFKNVNFGDSSGLKFTGQTRSTTLITPYFEGSNGSLIFEKQALGLKVLNPVLSGVKNTALNSAFIHHLGGNLDLSIDGGWVNLTAGSEQLGMKLIHSDNPSSLRLDIVKAPAVETSAGASFEIATHDVISKAYRVTGDVRNTYPLEMYSDASNGKITDIGDGSANLSYAISGRTITVNGVVTKGSTTQATNGGGFYFVLPRPSATSKSFLGSARVSLIDSSGAKIYTGTCTISSNKYLTITISNGANGVNNQMGGTLFNTALTGSFIQFSITYETA